MKQIVVTLFFKIKTQKQRQTTIKCICKTGKVNICNIKFGINFENVQHKVSKQGFTEINYESKDLSIFFARFHADVSESLYKYSQIVTSQISQNQVMITRKRAAEVMCAICMQVCEDYIGRIQCAHSYCFTCIVDWSRVSNSCPMCRQKMTQIQKLNVQKPVTKQFKNIQPQTIIVPQNGSEDQDSEWQWVISQRSLEQADFVQNLLINHIQQFSNENGEFDEERGFNLSIIFSNLGMIE